MTNEVLGMSLKVDTSGLKSAGIALDNLAVKGVQAGASASAFSGKIGTLNTSVKTFGTVTLPKVNAQLPVMTSRLGKFTSGIRPAKNAVQLLAYQAQDLAVQLSMGTSALVAFGQQSPQAFSAFGPSGAVLGAIAGVGFALAGPLITAFSDTGDAAKDFQSKIDDVRGSLESTAIEVTQGAIALLKTQIREAAVELDKLTDIPDRIGGRAVTGNRRLAIQKSNAAEIATIEKKQMKRLETLNKLKSELYELYTGEKIGAQTAIPEQNFDSFNLNDYFYEQEAAQAKANERSESLLISKFAREDALWSANNAKRIREEQQLAETKKQMKDLEISTTADMFGNLSEIAAAGGEESFTTYKRMAQAQAAVSAALAISNALAAPTGNPVLNGAMAVTVGALAGVQIAAIEQQEYTGARAMGGQVSANNSYIVGEQGPEIITMGAQGGFVTPNHKLGGGENVTVVNQIGNGVTGNTRAEIISLMPSIVAATSKAVRSRRV